MRFFTVISFFIVSISAYCYNGDTVYIFSEIKITGNTKTKQEVILRELPFCIADTIFLSDIETKLSLAKQNLIKTSLFNFVTTSFSVSGNNVIVTIAVEERWYFWPYPILEHGSRNWTTFLRDADWSRVNYGAALEVYNLGGLDRILKLKIRAGYREQFAASYFLNGLGERRDYSFKVQTELFRQKSVIYSIVGNDAVYYYGHDNYVFSNFNSGLVFSKRLGISSTLGSGLNYKNYFLTDTVSYNQQDDNFEYFSTDFVNPFVFFKADTRNSKVYPVSGLYFGLFAGYWDNLKNNADSFLGIMSDLNIHYNIPVDRLSVHLCTSYRFLYEMHNADPFFQSRLEFGRDFWTRGLEYYYFIGKNSIKVQTSLAFLISDFKIHNLPRFLPDEFKKTYSRVYLDIFLDYIYTDGFKGAYNNNNSMNGKLLNSFGSGLSLETYYDRLLQIYVAYVPYFGKTGIFVNYQTPLIKLY